MRFQFVLSRDDDDGDTQEIPVTVRGTYHPFSRGRSEYRGGPQIEPDDEEEYMIESVRDGAGNDVSTTPAEDEAIHAKALELAWEAAQERRYGED